MLPEARPTAAARFLTALAVASIAGTLVLVSRPDVAMLALVEKSALLLPGMLLTLAVAGPAAGWLAIAAFGPLLGISLSSLPLLAIWMAGGRGTWTLFVAPALLLPLVPMARRLRGRWQLPTRLPGDRAALAAAVLVVPLVVAAPFAHVGMDIPGGKAYRAYFTADYVWRRTVVAEVAKGDVPPANPFHLDDPLHYYWLPHLATAVAYRNEHSTNLDELLLANSVLVDVFFVAFLYGLARWFAPAPWAAAAGVVGVILCSSYEGLFTLIEYWSWNVPLVLVRDINIDAVTRWQLSGMPIDGLQRVLFYQPHHATGYAVGFMGVLAIAGRTRRFDPAAMAIGGLLLGLSTLISSFAGLMLTSVAALWEAGSVLRWREWWRAVAHGSAAALPLALSAALVTALQYVDTGGSIIRFGANPLAFHNVIEVTILSFGPVILISMIAAWAFWRTRDDRGLVFAALWVTCVFYYFWVDVRDHQDVYVGWRVGHLWFIASTALGAIACQRLLALPRVWRVAALALVLIAVFGALPTSLIDIYNTQDIFNATEVAGFRVVLLLSPEEQQAFTWIQANTPPGALFQWDALERGVEGWANLPAFAERRLAVGLPISMVPLRKYQEGARRATWLFESSSSEGAHEFAVRNGIEYVYLGGPERKRHPGAQQRFEGAPALFEPVFRNAEITIYRVR